jgi:hypothetical protein
MVVSLDDITGSTDMLATPNSMTSPAFSTNGSDASSTPRGRNHRSSSANSDRFSPQTIPPPFAKHEPIARASSSSSSLGMPAHLRPPSINLDLPENNSHTFRSMYEGGTPLGSPWNLGTPMGLWKATTGEAFNSTAAEDMFFEEILKSGHMFSPRGWMTPLGGSSSGGGVGTPGPVPGTVIATVLSSPKSNSLPISGQPPSPSSSSASGSVPIKQKLKASSPHHLASQAKHGAPSDPLPSSSSSPSSSTSSSPAPFTSLPWAQQQQMMMPPPPSPSHATLSPTSRAMNILLPLLHRHQQTIVSKLSESHDRVPLQMLPYFKFLNDAAQRSRASLTLTPSLSPSPRPPHAVPLAPPAAPSLQIVNESIDRKIPEDLLYSSLCLPDHSS